MTNSTNLVTDLYTLATTDFSPATTARATQRLTGHTTLTILAGIALARAGELKTALLQMQAVIDPNDPQLNLLNSILVLLN
jgi:hypothetical protein